MEYRVDDRALGSGEFLDFAGRIWPGNYDAEKTRAALARTLNITARDEGRLAGCLRILTDGYFFGTITELLVLPEYQGRGVGSALLRWQRSIRRRFCTSARSRAWRAFMKRTVASAVCRPTALSRRADETAKRRTRSVSRPALSSGRYQRAIFTSIQMVS